MSPEASPVPPKVSRLSPRWFRIVYPALGVVGLWLVAHPGPRPIPPLLLGMAVMLVSLPMLVVHELGHFIAGRAMGLRMIELSLGTGPIVWQRLVGDFKLVLRLLPVAGHVKHLRKQGTNPAALFVFIAGGPLANLLLAACLIGVAKVDLRAFFAHPTFPAVAAVANLWIALATLLPVAITSAASIAPGSDGWQLWRLLRGKSDVLDAGEIASLQKRKTGLAHLQSLARRSRVALLGGVVFLLLLLGFSWWTMSLYGRSASLDTAPLFGTLFLILAGTIVWLWRRPWIKLVGAREKAAANPFAQHSLAVQHVLKATAEPWHLLDLPQDALLEVTRSMSDPRKLGRIEELMRDWPQVRLLHLLYFDGLMAAGDYEKARTAMDAVLSWDDLPPLLREHLEVFRLAARLGATPDQETLRLCNEMAAGAPDNDGRAMAALVAFASTVWTAGHKALLPQAEQWCQRAQALYPFDSTVHTQLAIALLEQGRTADARPWLQAAQQATAGTNQSVPITAWQAVAAALDRRPDAAALLRQSLKQELPFRLRLRLEEALASASAATSPT